MSISKFKKKYKHVSTYKKINLIIKEKLKIIFKNQIKILEFGVDKGISTALFLEFCEKLNGSLYSFGADLFHVQDFCMFKLFELRTLFWENAL